MDNIQHITTTSRTGFYLVHRYDGTVEQVGLHQLVVEVGFQEATFLSRLAKESAGEWVVVAYQAEAV